MAAPPLTDAQRATLHDLLAAERDEARRRVRSLEGTLGELIDAADLEPPDDEHDPEGTTAYERAQVASLLSEARARLSELDRALTGVVAPGYGACERCGGPVGWPRLQARPGTTRCVSCAARP